MSTFMKCITVTIDRQKNSLILDVPIPAEGKWSPPATGSTAPTTEPTLEQRAYWTFWSLGTKERIDGLIGRDALQAKNTLLWLLNLRCMDVRTKTRFVYKLVVHEAQVPATVTS